MRGNAKQKPQKSIKYDLVFLMATLAAASVLLYLFPQRRPQVLASSWRFLVEMALILPAVMLLMGLFSAFVPRETVARYLGRAGGMRAVLLGLLLGTLPTGPLYVAFPMASALLRKGARIACVVAFLSAWACIRIPQEMVELQFLGLSFMAARLVLTTVFVVAMSLIVERVLTGRPPDGSTHRN